MSGTVTNNIFGVSGLVVAAAGGLEWQAVVVPPTTGRTFAVTVANPGAGNRYYIDAVLQATVNLTEGFTYIFDQSDSSNSGHPLRFSTTSNGSHGGGSEYTTGVTTSGTPGSGGAYTQIVVAADAPTLYYYCTAHSNMGGQANTVVSYVPVSSGKGYWINTTSDAATIKLPSSAEVGDQLIFGDYARTWATNAITIDSNGLNFQGEDDTFTVDYDTNGQAINIVYSGATKGWTPVSDIVTAFEPVAPPTQKGIFAYGNNGSSPYFVSMSNLVNSSGVIATDVTGVGTARYFLASSSYGGDKALFAFGANAGKLNIRNLVNNSGVIASDASGAGTARGALAAANYGGDKGIFGYGQAGGYVSLSNLVSNSGVVASDTTGVGTARGAIAACSYGEDLAIFGYGEPPRTAITNKVSNLGVIATDTTGVGTARNNPGAVSYGGDKGMFAYGSTGSSSSLKNLVSNTGIVSADVTGVGTARESLGATAYGGDKAVFAYGLTSSVQSMSNLVSNSGVIAADVTGVGTARYGPSAVGFSYSA
mgnify:FL=1